MNYERKSEEFFRKGYNCAQSVAAAFADAVGLSEETLLKLSCPFGGGFARKRNICGAVSGMGIILGLLYATDSPDAKKDSYRLAGELADKFAAEFGSMICAELLAGAVPKGGSPEPEKRTEEYYQRRRCVDCVKCAARLVEEEMRDAPEKI